MRILVNETELYYEKTGTGAPFILLHGNGERHEIFNRLVPRLSEKFTVYAIDSRGHGKSAPATCFDYQVMADDMVAFIKELQLRKPFLYGFSDGGILGLLIASQHPNLLSKLVISGVNITPKGLKSHWLDIFRLLYFFTKNARFKMMLEQPNISVSELSKIIIPTMVLAGSRDMVQETHTKMIAKSIPNATFCIVDGESHSSYIIHSAKLYGIMRFFITNEGIK